MSRYSSEVDQGDLSSSPRLAMWSSSPKAGCGVAKYAENLANACSENGARVHMEKMDFLGARMPHAMVWRTLRARPHLVVVQYTPPTAGPFLPFRLWLLRLLARRTRILVIAHEQPHVYARKLPRGLRWAFYAYERMVLWAAHRVLVHTTEHVSTLVGMLPSLREKITRVPHGVRATLAPTFALPPMQEGRILFFGALRPAKGIETLIEATSRLIERNIPVELVIAGSAPSGHEQYARALEAFAEVKNVAGHFLGFVEEDEIEPLISTANLLVLPYTSGTQSGVLHRAIESLVPIVASDIPAFRETVAREGLGVLFPVGDSRALAGAIELLITDEARRREIQRRQAAFLQENDWGVIVRNHILSQMPK